MSSVLDENICFMQDLESDVNFNFCLVFVNSLDGNIEVRVSEKFRVLELRSHEGSFRIVRNINFSHFQNHLIFKSSTFFESSLGEEHL